MKPAKNHNQMMANLCQMLQDCTKVDDIDESALPEESQPNYEPDLEVSLHMVTSQPPINVRVNLVNTGKIIAISDEGADACILGMNVGNIKYTGRYANLVGYDEQSTTTPCVPICSGMILVKSSHNGIKVVLGINEAPYLPHNSNTHIRISSQRQ